MGLKNKKILITAGPTWVPIDDVRVISNVATGETGILLAEKLVRAGARVTLFLGPVGHCCPNRRIRVINFKFFDELRKRLKEELCAKKYDIVIHSAAVSDFSPARKIKGKIASDKSHVIKLSLLPKITKDIKRLNPEAKLVIFKLEPEVSDRILIQRAKAALNKSKAYFVVANRLDPYRAFIIDSKDKLYSARSKKELVNRLVKLL